MEVKEMIEFLNSKRYQNTFGEKEQNKKVDDMISLIQQGEADTKELKVVKEKLKKVWQMWEELDDFIGFSDYDILQKMEKLKQKYFSKEE